MTTTKKTYLRNKNGGHSFVESCSVHVDCGSNGQDKPVASASQYSKQCCWDQCAANEPYKKEACTSKGIICCRFNQSKARKCIVFSALLNQTEARTYTGPIAVIILSETRKCMGSIIYNQNFTADGKDGGKCLADELFFCARPLILKTLYRMEQVLSWSHQLYIL
jgi:hypothetical protein